MAQARVVWRGAGGYTGAGWDHLAHAFFDELVIGLLAKVELKQQLGQMVHVEIRRISAPPAQHRRV